MSFIFPLIFLFGLKTIAFAKQESTWMTFGRIPACISTGNYKDQGFIDKATRMIHKKAS